MSDDRGAPTRTQDATWPAYRELPLAGKVALVTGGAKGIGAAIA
jgi:hypothetical protein